MVGHLLREGAACDRAWAAEVCREALEAEVHPWRFAEIEGVAPGNDAAD